MGRLVKLLLSDALLIWNALFILIVVFMQMAVTPSHTVMLEEPNHIILTAEIVACLLMIIWAVRRIIVLLEKERSGRH